MFSSPTRKSLSSAVTAGTRIVLQPQRFGSAARRPQRFGSPAARRPQRFGSAA